MRRISLSLDLIVLVRGGKTPLHRQLFNGLQTLILDGKLQPHTLLPSTREAARALGVGRNTVLGAYEALIADGYLLSRRGTGTWVADIKMPVAEKRQQRGNVAVPLTFSKRGAVLAGQPQDRSQPGARAFHPGYPETKLFPISTWSRMIRRHARQPVQDLFGYHYTGGLPALKKAIAEFVIVSRGVSCVADQVVITSGTQAALDLVARLLLDPGDVFWIEELAYKGAIGALSSAGGVPGAIPVSSSGWDFDSLSGSPPPKVIFLTPSCQWPLGYVMKLENRKQILELARQHRAWILEDDYDSEFRVNSVPGPALQGLDDTDQVIYLGTFSKTLFPALRIGFMIVPLNLVEGVEKAINGTGQYPPLLMQAALADFIKEGYFATHLKKMRSLYARRQSFFLTTANRLLSRWLDFVPAEAGMQIVGFLKGDLTDVDVAYKASHHGISVMPLSDLYSVSRKVNGLLFGYAGVNERETEKALLTMVDILSDT
ncbi:MAG: PLP-dependent aminotransferase family protein [Stappiaceae bacterium]